jgi:hypothetical protein
MSSPSPILLLVLFLDNDRVIIMSPSPPALILIVVPLLFHNYGIIAMPAPPPILLLILNSRFFYNDRLMPMLPLGLFANELAVYHVLTVIVLFFLPSFAVAFGG